VFDLCFPGINFIGFLTNVGEGLSVFVRVQMGLSVVKCE
jgi:hypothetical protein